MKPQRQRTQRVCVNNTVMFLRLTSRNQRNNYSLMSLLLIFLLNSRVFAWTTIANTCCSIFSQLAMSYCLKNTFKRFYLSICFFFKYMCGYLCEFICTKCMQVPKDARGGWIFWNRSSRQLWSTWGSFWELNLVARQE